MIACNAYITVRMHINAAGVVVTVFTNFYFFATAAVLIYITIIIVVVVSVIVGIFVASLERARQGVVYAQKRWCQFCGAACS